MPEVLADRGQGDADHRDVHGVEEEGAAEHEQHAPGTRAQPLGAAGGCSSSVQSSGDAGCRGLTRYQSAFILVSALPASARDASAILVLMATPETRELPAPSGFCRSGTAPSCAAESWARSCAAGASGSDPSRSGSLRRDGAARPGFGARRSLSSPGSASPGTRGSSRDATSIRRRRCSTRSRGPSSSTRTSTRTCSRWPASRRRPSRTSA